MSPLLVVLMRIKLGAVLLEQLSQHLLTRVDGSEVATSIASAPIAQAL
jgi:hypothetical protein